MRGRLRITDEIIGGSTNQRFEIPEYGAEIGLSLEHNEFWFLIPGNELPDGLYPLESEKDFEHLVQLVPYNQCQQLYSITRRVSACPDFGDFSFTQHEADERIVRIENIRDELEHVITMDEGQNQEEVNGDFEEDSCDFFNFDSCDFEEDFNEQLRARKKRKILYDKK
ncbi:hypothetical protein POM88_035024 [Heracleum sosnowskyi]|uniref:Uncharacterized protein n=1 Tax=Heracleum sosnowskyi TaxID=360622 RepID=A0AAD8HKE1_9APIA|nr:hypothetical protein POM88_035024 [Heracleum sosnowskyi]